MIMAFTTEKLSSTFAQFIPALAYIVGQTDQEAKIVKIKDICHS
jgi:hypothetical protein